MLFVKTILILSLGCLTLGEETRINDFDNLAKDIMKYMNQLRPQIESRMFVSDADLMDLSYIIANATKDILLNSKQPNDDNDVKKMITEMETTEIPQEVDFGSKDPTDDEIEKLLAPKAVIEENYTEVKSEKTKKDVDSDTETSYLLQNMEKPTSSSVDTQKKEIDSDTDTSSFLQFIANQMSSSEDTQIKDAPAFVPLYVMGRGRI